MEYNCIYIQIFVETWYYVEKCYNLPIKWVTFRSLFNLPSDLTISSPKTAQIYLYIPCINRLNTLSTPYYAENVVFCLTLKYYTFWLLLDALSLPSRWRQTLGSVPWVLGRLGHPQAPFSPKPDRLGGLQWLGDQPSPVASLLLSLTFPCICTDFPCILGPHFFYFRLPPYYNIGIGHPVFDRIELNLYHKWIQQLLYSWYMPNAVVPLFPVLCTSSITSPKH